MIICRGRADVFGAEVQCALILGFVRGVAREVFKIPQPPTGGILSRVVLDTLGFNLEISRCRHPESSRI